MRSFFIEVIAIQLWQARSDPNLVIHHHVDQSTAITAAADTLQIVAASAVAKAKQHVQHNDLKAVGTDVQKDYPVGQQPLPRVARVEPAPAGRQG